MHTSNPLANSKKSGKSGFSFMPDDSQGRAKESSDTKDKKDPFTNRFSKIEKRTTASRQSSVQSAHFGDKKSDEAPGFSTHKRQFTFFGSKEQSENSEAYSDLTDSNDSTEQNLLKKN